jgi:molybdenum cofactor synthesis domain-containing protein
MRVGVLTVSDRAAGGIYADRSGPAVSELLASVPAVEVVRYAVVPDSPNEIRQTLLAWADDDRLDVILTTGGTGFAPADVTPEVTRAIIEREAPGLVFAMLQQSLAITPHAMLSRPVAGIRGHTLIVNLPGSPKAARENLSSILPALPHAVDLLHGTPMTETDHAATQSGHR